MRRPTWRTDLANFTQDMKDALLKNISEKGLPSKENLQGCPSTYLRKKAIEHLEAGNYENAANFCFLLRQKQPKKDSP